MSIAGEYYCIKSEAECNYRDLSRIKDVSIEDKDGKKIQVCHGCNLAHLIEKESRSTARMYIPR